MQCGGVRFRAVGVGDAERGFGRGEAAGEHDAAVDERADALDVRDAGTFDAGDAAWRVEGSCHGGGGVESLEVDERAVAELAQGFAVGRGLGDDGGAEVNATAFKGFVEGVESVGEEEPFCGHKIIPMQGVNARGKRVDVGSAVIKNFFDEGF